MSRPDLLPTPDQVENYRRDGFCVVERFLEHDEVAALISRFDPLFSHEWETGIAPDEVNYDPRTTPPDLTRQLCNAWKADRTIAATTLAERNAAFAAALTGRTGLRIAQDNVIWKPPLGRALLAHQDGSYLDHLAPPNMVTCWMALDETDRDAGTIYYVRGSHRWPRVAAGGTFHAPEDWLSFMNEVRPAEEEVDLVPIEVPAGGAAFHDAWVFHGSPPNKTAGRQRRSVVSHLIDSATRFEPSRPHPIYSRYRRPGEDEMDEAFFPIIWTENGGRSAWLESYLSGRPANPGRSDEDSAASSSTRLPQGSSA